MNPPPKVSDFSLETKEVIIGILSNSDSFLKKGYISDNVLAHYNLILPADNNLDLLRLFALPMICIIYEQS